MAASEYAKAWDRVGRVMQAAGEVADVMIRRNLDVWSTVSAHLRGEGGRPYTAEIWAEDAANAVKAGIDNARDVWTVARTFPSGVANAAPVPTVCVFFEPNPEQDPAERPRTYVLTGQPEIPVSARVHGEKPKVHVRLTGPDDDSVKRLQQRLVPAYADDYRLVLVPKGHPALEGGIYQGLLYVDLNERPAPIALLWIIVS